MDDLLDVNTEAGGASRPPLRPRPAHRPRRRLRKRLRRPRIRARHRRSRHRRCRSRRGRQERWSPWTRSTGKKGADSTSTGHRGRGAAARARCADVDRGRASRRVQRGRVGAGDLSSRRRGGPLLGEPPGAETIRRTVLRLGDSDRALRIARRELELGASPHSRGAARGDRRAGAAQGTGRRPGARTLSQAAALQPGYVPALVLASGSCCGGAPRRAGRDAAAALESLNAPRERSGCSSIWGRPSSFA